MICYHDGTLEGIFTAVFDSWKRRGEGVWLYEGEAPPTLDGAPVQIVTDPEKARRIEAFCHDKVSPMFLWSVKTVFLAGDEDRDTAIARTIHRAVDVGRGIIDSVDPDVLRFNQLARNVGSERHKFLGLLRFEEMADGTLFAAIHPHNQILPLILSHFAQRLPGRRFGIWDGNRRLLAYHENGEFSMHSLDEPELCLSPGEERYRQLWRTFYKAIEVQGRHNPDLQRTHMPKRYWQDLTEKKPEAALRKSKGTKNDKAPKLLFGNVSPL